MSGQGKYKDTVRLPETAFPMRGDMAKREPELLAEWATPTADGPDLYARILASRAAAPSFVLHDGPPYANGSIHYGHILNKIMKDIVVKARTMEGFRAPYVPGWDTHGLPIELQVDRELGPKRSAMAPAEVRAACKAYAMKFVGIQREEFKRLGVLGQWDDPYLTLDPTYEHAIVTALAAFAEGGYLYRGKKPVYWCSRDKTALAEAEIEYKDKTSPSVYVRCFLAPPEAGGLAPTQLDARLAGKRVGLVIWTTTPWTLPANLAIVLHPSLAYVAVPAKDDPDVVYVIAEALAASFAAATGHGADPSTHIALTPTATRALEGTAYLHPFLAGPPVYGPGEARAGTPIAGAYRVWFADYVTAEAGTGLVHTAPGHGADDYKTGLAHDLPPYAPLDDRGRYVAGVRLIDDTDLEGKSTEEANPLIVALMAAKGDLLNPATDKIHHSYPHCWRCKQPILFRATPQWFIEMDHAVTAGEPSLRARALTAIKATRWEPAWGENRIYAMIENRPDWVLSRQRLWGVPIPAFYCTSCKTVHAEAVTMRHIAELFRQHGADAWWTLDLAALLPAGTNCLGCGADGATHFERERDIVDVWFESGVSWLAMQAKAPADHGPRPDGTPPIDLYLEGSDQHRGWFHSSLLAAIGVTGQAPYREVITHGFVLDEHGNPYSKSALEKAKAEGKKVSYIAPEDVIKKHGAELFRLWVASIEFRSDMPYSQTLLDGLTDWYRKFRNTARFVLGAVADFDPTVTVAPSAFRAVDRYLLAKTHEFATRCAQAYADYQFHVVHRSMVEFVTVELSAFYSDVVKDRLYCAATDAPERRAAQAVLYQALRAVTTVAAPILSFTAEDVWRYLPKRAGDPASVHMAHFEAKAGLADARTAPASASPETTALVADVDTLRRYRALVNEALEPFRAAKHKSTDAAITVHAPAADRDVLARYHEELAELCIVAEVTLAAPAATTQIEVAEHPLPRCERCWRRVPLAAAPSDVCPRCALALAALPQPL